MLLSLLGNIAKRGLPDRPYGLVYSDKETGFLPNLRAKTQYFRKNPVSGPLWIALMKKPLALSLTQYV